MYEFLGYVIDIHPHHIGIRRHTNEQYKRDKRLFISNRMENIKLENGKICLIKRKKKTIESDIEEKKKCRKEHKWNKVNAK